MRKLVLAMTVAAIAGLSALGANAQSASDSVKGGVVTSLSTVSLNLGSSSHSTTSPSYGYTSGGMSAGNSTTLYMGRGGMNSSSNDSYVNGYSTTDTGGHGRAAVNGHGDANGNAYGNFYKSRGTVTYPMGPVYTGGKG